MTYVAPFTGAWIETTRLDATRATTAWSPPSRGRGLKLRPPSLPSVCHLVAPFTGAWIETAGPGTGRCCSSVAPFTGAWIETTSWPLYAPSCPRSPPSRGRGLKHQRRRQDQVHGWSPPSRGRGLKLESELPINHSGPVAPFTGAWIETMPSGTLSQTTSRRPLHGGVD